MGAKFKYGFLCDGAMVVHGKWTYQGIFSIIHAPAFPTVHPEAVLVFQFSGPVGAHTLRVQLTDSTGKQLMPESRQPIECAEFKDTDVAVNIRGLLLKTPGFYAFKVFLDADTEPFGVVDFRAELLKPPGEAKKF